MVQRGKRSFRRNVPRVALTIAGSDSSAGAGMQADLKTFAAFGAYGVTAITCIVAETPGKVARIEAADPEIVRQQIELLLKTFPVTAIKTGLLCNARVVAMVARCLYDLLRKRQAPKLVVDPVMVATTGDILLDAEAIEIYERDLFPLATLITPNLDEGARLTGHTISNVREMRRAARGLAEKYHAGVLLKGGHLRGARAVDVLHCGARTREFSAPYIGGVATHGTGCTYSAAITAELAKNTDLVKAVQIGKRFVSAAIRHRFCWQTDEKRVSALNQSLNRSRSRRARPS